MRVLLCEEFCVTGGKIAISKNFVHQSGKISDEQTLCNYTHAKGRSAETVQLKRKKLNNNNSYNNKNSSSSNKTMLLLAMQKFSSTAISEI